MSPRPAPRLVRAPDRRPGCSPPRSGTQESVHCASPAGPAADVSALRPPVRPQGPSVGGRQRPRRRRPGMRAERAFRRPGPMPLRNDPLSDRPLARPQRRWAPGRPAPRTRGFTGGRPSAGRLASVTWPEGQPPPGPPRAQEGPSSQRTRKARPAGNANLGEGVDIAPQLCSTHICKGFNRKALP